MPHLLFEKIAVVSYIASDGELYIIIYESIVQIETMSFEKN